MSFLARYGADNAQEFYLFGRPDMSSPDLAKPHVLAKIILGETGG